MNGPIRRLALGVFLAMTTLLLTISWYQVIRADDLKTDPRNPRPLLTERGKERGVIITSDGAVVAMSVQDPSDRLSFVRQYPEGETFAHVVGFSSFLVGESGLEQAYSSELRSRRDLTISNLISVILGRFGAAEGSAAQGGADKTVRSCAPDDAAFLMQNAENVIIVPGYGLAVARAQHAVKEMAEKLREKGVNVRYAIHPVAGRMPGHMNVLLAEAGVPYDLIVDLEEVNAEFPTCDVALIIGANDVVNPVARTDKSSPIYGMPILDADKAQHVIVVKRSLNPGFAGIDNPIYYDPKTMMLFGDAKGFTAEMVKELVGTRV